MGVVYFPAQSQQRPKPIFADIERCVRFRGSFSLHNRFVIGKASRSNPAILYRIYICPWSLVDIWLPQKHREMEQDGMLGWADGNLTPQKMMFHSCDDAGGSEIAQVLAYAFQNAAADDHVEDFYNSEVHLPYLRYKSQPLTIANLIKQIKEPI